ncbi:MAG: hypothetical protein L6R28_01985 [Planctomycetes bacterium]|nr:hypothetical protein [Planctomycetota bacterium]
MRLSVRVVVALVVGIFAVALALAGGTVHYIEGALLGAAAIFFLVYALRARPEKTRAQALGAPGADDGLAASAVAGQTAEKNASDSAARFEAVVEAHRTELAHVPPPERHKALLAFWRGELKARAMHYLDMVDQRPEIGDQVAQLHIKALMHAYLAGYLAGRGWAAREEAQQQAATVANAVCEALRGHGLNLDAFAFDLEKVIARALGEIVAMGVKDGEEQRIDKRK